MQIMVSKAKVQIGQTLLDIALQTYGTVESVIDVMQDNGITDITEVVEGRELLIDSSKIQNAEVVAYYSRNDIEPNTGDNLFIPPFPNIFDTTFSTNFN